MAGAVFSVICGRCSPHPHPHFKAKVLGVGFWSFDFGFWIYFLDFLGVVHLIWIGKTTQHHILRYQHFGRYVEIEAGPIASNRCVWILDATVDVSEIRL